MKRPSKDRAHTFTGAMASLFSPFKGGSKPAPVPKETVGWRPNTLDRKMSGLSPHHVLGSPPVVRFEAAPNLKRQLSSGSSKDQGTAPIDIPTVDVTEVTSPGAQSCSSSSSKRVAFVPELLKSTDSSKLGNKLRQRAPSPYPDLEHVPPMTKQKEATRGEPLIRTRTRTLTMERMDGVNSLYQYLETHPDALPPPGSTPAFVEQYWHLRRRASDSSLSDPEADDEASDLSDGDSEDSDPGKWECDTALDSDDEHAHALVPHPPRRQYTPAAHRPPLVRHARTWPQPETPRGDYSPATRIASNALDESILGSPCPSLTASDASPHAPLIQQGHRSRSLPTYDVQSWLPTDPSNIDALADGDFDLIPRLCWEQGLGADGLGFTSSLRPANGATAGKANGAWGPSHTPNPGCFHDEDPRLDAVDAGELAARLERARSCNGGGAYDADQERIRRRYAGWEGGVGREVWDAMVSLRRFTTAKTSHGGVEGEEAQAAGVEAAEEASAAASESEVKVVEALEAFPQYQHAEDRFAELSLEEGDGTTIQLPDYAAADPSNERYSHRPKIGGCLPKSKAHRQRAASRLGASAVQQQQQQREMRFPMQMVGASGIMA